MQVSVFWNPKDSYILISGALFLPTITIGSFAPDEKALSMDFSNKALAYPCLRYPISVSIKYISLVLFPNVDVTIEPITSSLSRSMKNHTFDFITPITRVSIAITTTAFSTTTTKTTHF